MDTSSGGARVQRALICNGLFSDEGTRTVREGGAPDAEYLAREREDAVAQATQLVPLALSILRPEDRSVVTARVLHALNVAQLIPVPPWLCVHAWRNGLAAAEFRFKLSDGEDALVAALEQHAADMLTLYTSPRIPEPAVHRIMNGICRPTQLPRLSAARAAGALPASFEVKLKLMDADNCCTFFGNSYGLQGEHAAEVAALSERLFLESKDGWLLHGVRCFKEDGKELQLAAAVFMLRVPCARCSGASVISRFYHYDSPTWRSYHESVERSIRRLGASATPRPCMCKRCAWCEAPDAHLRACAGCTGLSYCSKACQRLAWPAHKEQCRAAAAKARS